MNRDALCRILGLHGVPPKLTNLMSELYSGTKSAVRCGDIDTYGTGQHLNFKYYPVPYISLTYFQLLLNFVRGVYWPPHFSALAWTGF